MCGIAGYFTKDNINNSIIAEEMIDCMRHRGPDAQGYEVIESNENNLVLAHTRLSIQDLSPLGNQPFINKDKDVFLVFNGEIYNFQDLRKQLILKGYRFTSSSDTEVLLYSYIEWGEDLTNHIKGDFAFCIVDKRINKLLLYRDPLGVKPVYYLLSGDSFVFSSEIKAILRFPGVKKEINKDVLAEYLINGWVYEPDTMFKDIKKLEAGHFIKLNLGDRTFEKIKYFDISSKDSETDLDKLIDKALKYQTISDAPLGLYLSGGVDSSVIAAKVKKTGRIFTLTASMKEDELSYEGFEDDLKYAKEVVNQYENLDLQIVELDYSMIDYYKKLVYYIEEPIADPAIVPAYLLAKKARDKGFKVMLSGMGADELFGGYSRYLAYSKISSIVLGRQIAFIVKTFSKFGQYLLRKGKFLKLFRDLERISNALSKKFPLNYIYLMSYCSEKEVLDLVGSDSVNKFYKKAAGFSELKNLTELQKISYIDLKGFLASH
ncbi:MAG: asparagine synthase (glutamine-hydrolyzing), partial [Bacillota bacterium]